LFHMLQDAGPTLEEEKTLAYKVSICKFRPVQN